MKHTWSIDDVEVGMLVCKPPGKAGASDGWFAKWSYKVGWLMGMDGAANYVLIAMSDGMVHLPRTKAAIQRWLIEEGMVPMREEWWTDVCRWMRNTLAFDTSPPPVSKRKGAAVRHGSAPTAPLPRRSPQRRPSAPPRSQPVKSSHTNTNADGVRKRRKSLRTR